MMIQPKQYKRVVALCFVLLMAIIGLGAKTYELHFEVQGLRLAVRDAILREAETSSKVADISVSVSSIGLLLSGAKKQ